MRVAVSVGTARPAGPRCRARRRGHEPVPLGRAAWDELAAALAGCDAAYLIAPNMHHDEPAYVGVGGRGRASRRASAGWSCTRSPRRTSPRCRTTSARPWPRTWSAAAGLAWTILQPGPYLQNLDLTRTVRIAYRADAPFGFADLDDVAEAAATVLSRGRPRRRDVRAGLAADHGRRAGRGGRRGRRGGHPEEWAATDGAGLDPRVRDWLLAMFAYYDVHGLPVGTLPLRTLLGR